MKVLFRSRLIAAPLFFVLLVSQPAALFAQQTQADREKYDQAVALFKDASKVSETAPEEQRRAAIKKFLSAADIFHAIGSRAEEAKSISAAANLYDGLSETSESLGLYIKVADLYGDLNDRPNLAETLNTIGFIYHQAGLNSKALEYLNVALAFRRVLKDEPGEATTLTFIGMAQNGLGEKQKSIDAFNQSLVIRKRIDDKRGQVILFNNLAVVYTSLGENEKALGFLDQCLKLARALGDKVGEAAALHNLANTYNELGDSARALDNYGKALELIRLEHEGGMEGDILNNMGVLYMSNGDLKKARDFLYRALQLRFNADNLTGAIETLINIGYLHSELGEKEEALRFYNQALRMSRKQENISDEADILHNIGYLYELNGEPLKALEYYNQALPLRRQVGDKTGETETLSNMMMDWKALGNGRLAVLYGKQAINRFQEMRSAIKGLDASVRKKYLSSIEGKYRYLAEILIEQGRIAEAEQVLEMLKEEEVFTYQRRDDRVARDLLQTSTLTQTERDAITGYEKFAERITAIAKEYGDLDRERLAFPEGQFPKQARLDELDKQRADALVAFQKYLDQLKVDFARTSKEKDVALVDSSLRGTLRDLNADHTAVVSTIAGTKRLNIIVTTADVQRAHTIDITEENLNQLVAEFRQALTSPATGKPVDPRPAGQKLYDVLVKPIEGDLAGIKADTIVWSLDGALRYLPMAALWDKQRGYLAERFANAVVTLASRDRLILAKETKPLRALGAGVSAPVEGFSALAAVPDELDCIVTDPVTKTVSQNPVCATGVLPGQKLLDEKFNEATFRSAIGRYSVLHIASHFKLVPGNDDDSFLLLGGGDDRHFTVNKLNKLSLSGVELLALSACNTATPGGAKENGIEIEGFGAVAQKLGARSVMATLWPVADPSTRDFMVEFYRRFGGRTETKAESIRQAQLKLMRGSYPADSAPKPPRAESFASSGQAVGPPFVVDKNAPYAHPYYWAPFILFGNWQ